MKNIFFHLFVDIVFILNFSLAHAFDDKTTHKDLSELAVNNSQLSTYITNQFDISNLLFKLNDGENAYNITQWFQEGSYEEDQPSCRASSHFHDPLITSWSEAKLTDPNGVVDLYCDVTSPFREKYSALIWATGYSEPNDPNDPPVNNNPEAESNGRNWDVARDFLYQALTSQDPVQREANLAQTFNTLGYILHLLQDMASPAHTRNDFLWGHSRDAGCPDGKCEKWYKTLGNPFEAYVRDHYKEIRTAINNDPELEISLPYTGEKTLTNFWDTNTYNPDISPPTDSQDIGLAEYSNGNFVSYASIMVENQNDEHYFPYPNRKSIEDPGLPDHVYEGIYEVMKEDGRLDKSIYIKKTGHGEIIDNFLTWRYVPFESATFMIPYYLSFMPDETCFLEYAKQLIPRAVGYSAGLIDYFFRGSLEITQPYSGGYALALNQNEEITRITLRARNNSPAGETMDNGELQLVAKYRVFDNDPFQNYDTQSIEESHYSEFHYSLFSISNNVTAIPDDQSVELIFDLVPGSAPIPLTATDVFLQIIYRGQLGQENDAVAVGFKDIAEPTPIDILNNTVKTCINGNWEESGSLETVNLVDKDGGGTADPFCSTDGHDCEADVYPHHIHNVYLGIYPADRPENPSSTNYDIYFDIIQAGDAGRIFVLADYDFIISVGSIHELNHYFTDDLWTDSLYQETQMQTHAIKNQLETITDENICSSYGLSTPCASRTHPQFKNINNIMVYDGIVLDNAPYPNNSTCTSLF